MFLERIFVKSGPSAAASADQQQINSGANRKVINVSCS